jgi:hypothetical protein
MKWEVEQLSLFDTWFGKTSPEPSQATEEKISRPSLRKSSASQSQTPLMCLYLGGGKRWPKAGTLMGNGANGQPFSVAYRVHDAQYWGVPQRRKRIALVADFGGLTAPEILFERKGLPRDSEQGETQRKGTAENAVGCADEASVGVDV